MGFIDQEEEQLRQQVAINNEKATRAAAEKAEALRRKANAERIAAERRPELERLGRQDNQRIIEILDGLPFKPEELKKYLKRVGEITHYECALAFYSQIPADLSQELISMIVNRGLVTKGEAPPIVNPSSSTFGDEVIVNYYESMPKPEPHGPGIGIRFRRQVTSPQNDPGSKWFSTLHLKLTSSKGMFITGKGTPVEYVSLRGFDNWIQKGFKSTNFTRIAPTSPQGHGGRGGHH